MFDEGPFFMIERTFLGQAFTWYSHSIARKKLTLVIGFYTNKAICTIPFSRLIIRMPKKESMAKIPGERSFDDSEDTASYNTNSAAFKPGIKPNEVTKYYTEWALNGGYDKDLNPERYRGPELAADAIAAVMTNTDGKVLDVAAGTGRLGQELVKKGLTNLDALDPSEGMLSVAEKLGIYSRCICDFMSDKRLDVVDDTYDCLGIAGGMGEGHIPCCALGEMIRVVKRGGHVVIVMREEYLTYVTEYIDRLEPMMKRLEDEGRWKKVSRTIVPEYFLGINGIVFVFQVL